MLASAQFAHVPRPCWALDFIKANREAVERAIRDKGVELDLDALLALDAEVRGAQDRDRGAARRAQRDQRQVQGRAPGGEGRAWPPGQGSGRAAPASWKASLPEKEAALKALMLKLPGIPCDGAPVGPDESFNTVIRTDGEPPKFDFEPLDHVALIEKNDWARSVAGSSRCRAAGPIASRAGWRCSRPS